MSDQTVMGELPAVGATTATARTANSEHATTLTISEAAARSGISITTWRRRLQAGQVAGAYKAVGAQGEQWQIPITALDSVAVIKAAPVISAETETISELVARLATAESQLAVQRALADERLMMLDQLHATVRALGSGISEPKAKRWWSRSH
jgi:hypothetical protein